MSQDNKYPNGLQDYLETLVMISAELADRDLSMLQVNYIDLAIDWAEEFEQIHNGRLWDGDWFDAIQEFMDEKFSKL
jgi:hypothetical protein